MSKKYATRIGMLEERSSQRQALAIWTPERDATGKLLAFVVRDGQRMVPNTGESDQEFAKRVAAMLGVRTLVEFTEAELAVL